MTTDQISADGGDQDDTRDNERWRAFEAYNTEAASGFGAASEAWDYCAHLNRDLESNRDLVRRLEQQEVDELMLDDPMCDVGIVLDETLQAIADWEDEMQRDD